MRVRPTFFVGMDGANVPFEMFAPDKTLSTPVGMAGIGPHALFCLVPAGGVDGLTVGGGDFAPAGLFGEVGNRDGDFGYGAGCTAGGADGMGVDEGGGVDGGGGGHKFGVGGVGEVEAVAGDVVGRGVAGGAEGEVREVHGGLGRAVGEEGKGVGEGVGGGEDVEGEVEMSHSRGCQSAGPGWYGWLDRGTVPTSSQGPSFSGLSGDTRLWKPLTLDLLNYIGAELSRGPSG